MAATPPTESAARGLYEQPVLVLDPGMHTLPIMRADVDGAGAYAVTGSYDRTIRIWLVHDGSLERTIRLPMGPGHVGKVFPVAISADGRFIAAAGYLRQSEAELEQIFIFDRATGAMVRRLEGVCGSVWHLAFSPNGRYLAAGLGNACCLRVYDGDTGWAEAASDNVYFGECYGVAFSPDGRLATASLDGKLRLYDAQFRLQAKTGTFTLAPFEAPTPYSVAFSPDGLLLAVGYHAGTKVDLFDGVSLERLPAPDCTGINGELMAIAWSVDGTTLYAGGGHQEGGKSTVIAWSEGGAGARQTFQACGDTIMSIEALPDGGLFVASQDPYVAVLDKQGRERWALRRRQADFRRQSSVLAVSADGRVVDFGYEVGGRSLARFDLVPLALRLDPPNDSETAKPDHVSLPVEFWKDSVHRPTLAGAPLPWTRGEISRSLAIQPDKTRFVLGTEWLLRVFDKAGVLLWQLPAPGIVWAVNITGDGRLVVAGFGDGTIRWHRIDDGRELLAFYPLADRKNWIAWTPEGFYAATPGAYGLLRWHVNRGWDLAAEAIPVDQIKELRRPEVLPLVLQEMEVVRALGLADLAAARRAVQVRTGSSMPPGAQLHILALGVSDFGAQAKNLKLKYADQDAWDVANALVNTQGSLYVDISLHLLRNEEVNRKGIFWAFEAMRKRMARGDLNQDLAIVLFSGHGALVDDCLYLVIYGVDASTPVDIKATAIPIREFREELHKLGACGRVLVLLDACHSGAATADGTPLPMNSDLLRAALATTNVTVLTSCSSKEMSFEDDRWQNGAFTEAFLEALRQADTDKNGLISVTELTSYLATHVPRLTDNKQKPGIEVRFQSDLFVAGL